LVGRLGREVLLQQVLRNAMRWVALRRHPKAPLGTSSKSL
jgi:hypothetical protein